MEEALLIVYGFSSSRVAYKMRKSCMVFTLVIVIDILSLTILNDVHGKGNVLVSTSCFYMYS